MIIRQNDLVILKGENEPRRVLSIEHHYFGDYYLFENMFETYTINIVDIDATMQYNRDLKTNFMLDGCHSL